MTSTDVPDPIGDPEGYALWCEMHACGGSGVAPDSVPDFDEDDD